MKHADPNKLARQTIKKLVKTVKPETPVPNPPASSILSMLSSRLPSSAPAIPRGTPIVQPAKKKGQPKGGEA